MGAEFPPPQSFVNDTSKINYEEVEKVFALADDVYRKHASLRARINFELIIVSICPALVFIMLMTMLFQYGAFDNRQWGGDFAVVAAIVLIAFGTSIVAASILRRMPNGARLRAETRALHRVVSLLHELEQDLDGQSNWSPVQKAEFRIRVSRYVLPDYQPSFIERLYGLHR